MKQLNVWNNNYNRNNWQNNNLNNNQNKKKSSTIHKYKLDLNNLKNLLPEEIRKQRSGP